MLPALDPSVTSDVLVVGCGPAGLYLAALLAKRGLKVALIGHDVPFVNNYGVWLDEWQALGLMGTLECSWPDAVCYFGEGRETRIGRGYGRVSRRLFRSHLLEMCREAGVQFLADEVDDISLSADGKTSRVATKKGAHLAARLVNVSAGAAAGKFLKFDDVDAPSVAAQTAYGIEAEVEGYPDGYPADLMLFMDFRRHHTGVNDGMAHRLKTGVFEHPNSGGGLWGSASEPPSFLYAMPLGGRRVFLEETCLVAKPALPFAVLKRRLERRLRAMNVKVRARPRAVSRSASQSVQECRPRAARSAACSFISVLARALRRALLITLALLLSVALPGGFPATCAGQRRNTELNVYTTLALHPIKRR